jgi:hypothetical protein
MSIECHDSECIYHSTHYGCEGPFCDETECRKETDKEKETDKPRIVCA